MYKLSLLNFSLYDLFFCFIIYSFLGWCVEVIYAAKSRGEFVNRGFLYGPFCPIYGAGVTSILVLLKPFESNLLLLFIGSTLLTSAIEYITGFALEKLFNSTWWDYSDDPFNLHGRICLLYSLIWGFFGVIILKIIHPVINFMLSLIPLNYGVPLFYVMFIYFIFDFIITLSSLLKLKSLFIQINTIYSEFVSKLGEFKDSIRDIRDINELIPKLNSSKELNNSEEHKKRRADIEKLSKEFKNKYEALVNKNYSIFSRLIKAFPNIKLKSLNPFFKDIKNKILKLKNNTN